MQSQYLNDLQNLLDCRVKIILLVKKDLTWRLGKAYLDGHYGKINRDKGLSLLINSAESGNANGQNELGWRYADGCGISEDIEKAIYWLAKSAAQENSGAQWKLGMIYCQLNDNDKAIYWLMKAAELGNAWAMRDIGVRYANGFCISKEKNATNAKYWLIKAAKKGDTQAKYELGKFYIDKDAEFYNINEGAFWLEKAANQGHSRAQWELFVLFSQNEIIYDNQSRAIKWLKVMKTKGLCEANWEFIEPYLGKVGKTQDDNNKIGDALKRAAQCYAPVEWLLVNKYRDEENIERLFYWLCNLARHGDKDAIKEVIDICQDREVNKCHCEKIIYDFKSVEEQWHYCVDEEIMIDLARYHIKASAFQDAAYWLKKIVKSYYKYYDYPFRFMLAIDDNFPKQHNKVTSRHNWELEKAQMVIGISYQSILGDKLSATPEIDAEYWLEKSAMSGNPEFQAYLGFAYYDSCTLTVEEKYNFGSINISKNMEKADYWLKKAAGAGHKNAIKHLSSLKFKFQKTLVKLKLRK
jgi:hypothetical protein